MWSKSTDAEKGSQTLEVSVSIVYISLFHLLKYFCGCTNVADNSIAIRVV